MGQTRYALSFALFSFALPGILAGQNGNPPAPAPSRAQVTVTYTPMAQPSAAIPAPIVEAQKLLRSGKVTESEAAYNAILKEDPKSAFAYVGLTRVYLQERRVTDADAAAAKASELAPQLDAAKVALAEVRFREGRIPEAQDLVTPLVKANTAEARAYFCLGKIYWASSYYQHGKLLLDLAHQKDADDPEILVRWLTTLPAKEKVVVLKGNSEAEGKNHSEEGEGQDTNAEPEGGNRKGCRLVSTATESHQEMERLLYGAQRIRGYGLNVDINGTKGRLLLDSGASGILINRKMAQKAGVETMVKTDIHGIGDKGPVAGYVGTSNSIKIGNLEFQGCLIAVEDRNSVAEEDGIIGPDVFNKFLVDIDFPNYKLNLTPLPPIPPPSDSEKALVAKYPNLARFRDRIIPKEFQDFTPVYRFGHMLLIPTRINELPSKLFLIDTGAFSDTISPAAAREATKVRSDADMKVKGISGNVNNVFSADELTLTFSHFKQPAKDMVAFDTTSTSNSAGVEISGFLGFAMLYQMDLKIDYRDGLVDFGYNPNRFH